MNNSSKFEGLLCSQYENPTNPDIARVMLTLVIFTGGFGILGNIFIIVLAVKYTVRRSIHHLIIIMAAADILVVIMTFGVEIASLFEKKLSNMNKVLGDVLCPSMDLLLTAGMWTTFVSLLIITIGRFRATLKTTLMPRPYTLKQRSFELICCCLTAVLMTTLEMIAGDYIAILYGVSENVLYKIRIFTSSITIGSYCTIFVLNFIALRRLSNQQEIQNSIPEAQRQARKKRTSNALKMVLSSLLLYTCCYLPHDVAWMSMNIKEEIESSNYIIKFFFFVLFPMVNSCFSPLIYMAFMSDFREAAKRLMCKRSRRNDGASTKHQQTSTEMLEMEENIENPKRVHIASGQNKADS